MKLSNFSIHRPITTLMMVVCIVVIGWISLPDLSSPEDAESTAGEDKRAGRKRGADLRSIPLEYLPAPIKEHLQHRLQLLRIDPTRIHIPHRRCPAAHVLHRQRPI